MNYRNSITAFLIAAIFLAPTACTTVPKESVRLSEAVGKDIEQLYQAYRKSVQASFASMREAGLTIIDERWTPVYLKTLIVEGDLVTIAKQEKTTLVALWARAAIEDIDEKRQAFLAPLQAKEAALLSDIDAAFGQTRRMNATVTGYLGSIRKVKEFQDQILDDTGLKEMAARLNAGIVDASSFANNLTQKIDNEVKTLNKGLNP